MKSTSAKGRKSRGGITSSRVKRKKIDDKVLTKTASTEVLDEEGAGEVEPWVKKDKDELDGDVSPADVRCATCDLGFKDLGSMNEHQLEVHGKIFLDICHC